LGDSCGDCFRMRFSNYPDPRADFRPADADRDSHASTYAHLYAITYSDTYPHSDGDSDTHPESHGNPLRYA